MELFCRFLKIIDVNLIYCLIPIILTLFFVELFFKNRFETRKALNLIRWTIISYTIMTLIHFLIGIFTQGDEYVFITRPNGSYKIAYLISLSFALFLPFTLMVKSLWTKFGYILLVAFLMKAGFYFERYVIIVTSLHEDYLPQNESFQFVNSLLFGIGMIFLQGLIITIIILGLFEILKRKNLRTKK